MTMRAMARVSIVLGAAAIWGCGPGARQSLPAAAPASSAGHATGEGSGPRVLRVGSYRGIAGGFSAIQDAVNVAKPGDWVLVGPGVYHEAGSPQAGVLVTTPNVHLRGMDRNGVVVDGAASKSTPCSPQAADQDPGPLDAGGSPVGRNGIEVLKADGVSVENLTVCNFLAGSAGNGNAIWFNGGDDSGQIGLGAFRGAFLTASSTFFDPANPAMSAQYGIFASNSRGPGVIEDSYASNMADSSIYVGACPDCNTVVRRIHAENSAVGYSGSNSGGHLVLEDSEWNDNRSGMVPNSLANDDPPSPQDGACPDHPTKSCTLIQGNWVHDNNNPNTPAVGLTAGAPVGTGIEISGGRNNTVRHNLVSNHGSWGILVHDYPDTSPASVPTYCAGGIPDLSTALGPACYFIAYGNRVIANRLEYNGFFGNPTNGDLGDATIPFPPPLPPQPGNCFAKNCDPSGGAPSSDPANIQDPSVLGTCGVPGPGGDTGVLFAEIICAAYGPASGFCPPGSSYPQPTTVVMKPIPRDLPGMADPCLGVPDNSWCAHERDRW